MAQHSQYDFLACRFVEPKQQQHTQKLPSGVPDGIETANKTGELDYVQGDAAIVYAPSGTYILVMIGDGLSDSYGQIPFFGEVSEIVYHFFVALPL